MFNAWSELSTSECACIALTLCKLCLSSVHMYDTACGRNWEHSVRQELVDAWSELSISEFACITSTLCKLCLSSIHMYGIACDMSWVCWQMDRCSCAKLSMTAYVVNVMGRSCLRGVYCFRSYVLYICSTIASANLLDLASNPISDTTDIKVRGVVSMRTPSLDNCLAIELMEAETQLCLECLISWIV